MSHSLNDIQRFLKIHKVRGPVLRALMTREF